MVKAAVATVMAALALVSSSHQVQHARINVTATVADTSFAGDRYVRHMILWNHQKSVSPIGQSWEFCFSLNTQRNLACFIYFELPGGKLVASGVTRHTDRFWMPCIGASGRYNNLSGSLRMRRDPGPDDFTFLWLLTK